MFNSIYLLLSHYLIHILYVMSYANTFNNIEDIPAFILLIWDPSIEHFRILAYPTFIYYIAYMGPYSAFPYPCISLHLFCFKWDYTVHFHILAYPCICIAYIGSYRAFSYPWIALHLYCLYGIKQCISLSWHITAFI